MNRHRLYVFPLSLTLLLCSCASVDEPLSNDGSGCISPAVVISDEMVNCGRSADVNPSDFSLTITSVKSGEALTWETISNFPLDLPFAIGEYRLTAAYGDIDNEGPDKPCYNGEALINVFEATTTTATIRCTIANALISVVPSDKFKGYFSSYSIKLNSPAGNTWSDFEDSPIYIKPGTASLDISVVNPNGSVAAFSRTLPEILPQHHYRLNIDANNGEVGQSSITITLDDSTHSNTINVDLTEELLLDI